ncbi:MAG: hypothetical protein ACKV2U_09150 [Bryobacteraceae bacterium]
MLILAGCAREQTPPFRRLAVLPIENLATDPLGSIDAVAIQLAIWDSLQAQPALYAVMAGHRRDLPELQAAYVVDGYVADGRFQLRVNDKPVICAGSLADCASRLVADIAGHASVTPRAIPKADSLRLLVRAAFQGERTDTLETAVAADPAFSALWIGWAGQAQAQGGAPAALAVLNRAPVSAMPAYDAAKVRLRLADLRQDRKARAEALVALARLSPADIELQEQAARESTLARDLVTAAEIYDRMIVLSPHPPFLNQAAYLAAFMGDRAKAERHAAMAQSGAPNDPRYMDTRGEIAYFFADFASASRYFEQAANLNITFLAGQDLWKAADAARMAGDKTRAAAMLTRYLDFQTKSGMRNTLLLQAVWDWRGDAPDSAMEKLRIAADSMDRGKALFLETLIALNRRDMTAAQRVRQQMDPSSIEAAFLRSVMDGTAPPPGLPFPPEAVSALHHFLRGENKAALDALAIAKTKMDPLADGQWRKLEATLSGGKMEGSLPASPDDWLAVLLR